MIHPIVIQALVEATNAAQRRQEGERNRLRAHFTSASPARQAALKAAGLPGLPEVPAWEQERLMQDTSCISEGSWGMLCLARAINARERATKSAKHLEIEVEMELLCAEMNLRRYAIHREGEAARQRASNIRELMAMGYAAEAASLNRENSALRGEPLKGLLRQQQADGARREVLARILARMK